MLDYLAAAGHITSWGIVLVVIIVIAIAVQFSSKSRGRKAAICQIFVFDGDREGNLLRIENAVREAKEKGAELLCFAETMLLGWLNPDAHKRACPIPGTDADRLCELARRYGVYLCVGLAEKEADKLYNSAILIDDKGDILLKHRETNIPSRLMEPPYTPGSDMATVDTKFGKIGMLICSETHREDILERMAEMKPDILLIPYGYAEYEPNWPGHGTELHELVTKTATTTQTTVIGTNLLGQITKGPWAGRIYGGQSIAVDKTGRGLAIAKDRDRDIKVFCV